MKDVFISYKAEEIEEAGWVKSVLESNGISCWMAPSCIPGGSSYAVEIPHAIKEAKVFVLVLSAKAQSSRWVSREIDLALNEGKVVLPFMLENCDLKDDFNFYLTNVQRYAAYENKVAAMEKMVREIKAILGTEDNEPELKSVEAPKVEKKIEAKKEKKETKSAKKSGKWTAERFSLLSFIFGVLAMVCLLGMIVVPNILAIVFAFAALSKMTEVAGKNQKMMIAGFVLGAIGNLAGFTLIAPGVGTVVGIIADIVVIYIFVKKYKAKKS